MLVHHPTGHYSFLPGIDPYSCGVIADPGFEIVHVTLESSVPWQAGFNGIADYLHSVGAARSALCAIELRSPAPYTLEGFLQFNRQYCAVLEEWGLFVDQINPLARTNVAPVRGAPDAPHLFAFSHVARTETFHAGRSFVVAGAGELLQGKLELAGIVRRGESSVEAMREKADFVAKVMCERVAGLGAIRDHIVQVSVYTEHVLEPTLADSIMAQLPIAQSRGCHWYRARPPVKEIEFEMDVRGFVRELHVSLT